jgi:hypothetical protein
MSLYHLYCEATDDVLTTWLTWRVSNKKQELITLYKQLVLTQLLRMHPYSNDRHFQYIVAHRMCLAFPFHRLLNPKKDICYNGVKRIENMKMKKDEVNQKLL